jgi:hypothetical protein
VFSGDSEVDDDVIYFQYDSSTPLVFRPCMMHPRKVARQGQEIALPGLLDSERNETDKHPYPFLFFWDAHHQSAQSSHYPLDPSINFTPQFFKRQHPHVAEGEITSRPLVHTRIYLNKGKNEKVTVGKKLNCCCWRSTVEEGQQVPAYASLQLDALQVQVRVHT